MTLVVREIFASLQGEGFWTGTPMTFIRLAGCNAADLGLGCLEWCDTPESWDPEMGRSMETEFILDQVRLPRLCLTGGEPLLQREGVGEFMREAARRLLRVHLETNGTIAPGGALATDGGVVWSTVSPKPPDYVVADGWQGLVNELKLVLDDTFDAATAERLAARFPGAVVSIQPVWGASLQQSTEQAVTLVMAHPEWRLSLQTHKFLGLR